MKLLGVSDDITTCECCGRKNLKRTVALETADGGIVHYGVDCAAKALNMRYTDVALNADVIAYARKWLAKYQPQTVAQGVWNKFGYLTEVKGDTIRVWAAKGIVEITKES